MESTNNGFYKNNKASSKTNVIENKDDYHDEHHIDDHLETHILIPANPYTSSSKHDAPSNKIRSGSAASTAQYQAVEPPDGGYGWVIVAVAFFVSVLSDGVLYSFGIYLPIYINAFNSQAATVSWISSFSAGSDCLLSMFSGYYADKYGNKKVLFAGGLIVTLGFFLASFATDLWQLFLTQGLICGIGWSLAYTSAMSVVGQWFNKRRGIAVGISVCGSGIGVFIMVQIQSALLNQYGWQMTLRWMALIEVTGMTACAIFVKRLLPPSTHNANTNKAMTMTMMKPKPSTSTPPMTTSTDEVSKMTNDSSAELYPSVKRAQPAQASLYSTLKECYHDPHYFWLYMGYTFGK